MFSSENEGRSIILERYESRLPSRESPHTIRTDSSEPVGNYTFPLRENLPGVQHRGYRRSVIPRVDCNSSPRAQLQETRVLARQFTPQAYPLLKVDEILNSTVTNRPSPPPIGKLCTRPNSYGPRVIVTKEPRGPTWCLSSNSCYLQLPRTPAVDATRLGDRFQTIAVRRFRCLNGDPRQVLPANTWDWRAPPA